MGFSLPKDVPGTRLCLLLEYNIGKAETALGQFASTTPKARSPLRTTCRLGITGAFQTKEEKAIVRLHTISVLFSDSLPHGTLEGEAHPTERGSTSTSRGLQTRGRGSGSKIQLLAMQDRIMLPAGLDILGRPKGENRIALGFSPGTRWRFRSSRSSS